MKLHLSAKEHAYIVDNSETDLALTALGMALIEKPRTTDGETVIEASQTDYEEFLSEVREEFIWKSRRLSNPQSLIDLARRLLPDFESLEPMGFD